MFGKKVDEITFSRRELCGPALEVKSLTLGAIPSATALVAGSGGLSAGSQA